VTKRVLQEGEFKLEKTTFVWKKTALRDEGTRTHKLEWVVDRQIFKGLVHSFDEVQPEVSDDEVL
jgi:hypothetical protein